jgi:pimeloyl-ACP methyl ester carboxylesterase
MFFVHKGVSVHYRRQGDGPPLLLLHGWGADGGVFSAAAEHFSKRFDVIIPDFPPFGLSSELEGDYTVDDYKDLVLSLMDALGIGKADIICHSFGGRVGAKLTAGHPERAGKIVFCASAGLPYKKSLGRSLKKARYRLARLLASLGIIKKERLKKYFSLDYRVLPENMRGTFKNIVSEDLTETISKIRSPSLIIWGDKDRQTPYYMAKRWQELVKGSALVTMHGYGHYCFLDDAERFLRACDEFLRQEDRKARDFA